MLNPRTFISRWFPIGLWIAAIYFGSSRPALPGPFSDSSDGAQLLRKAIHLFEYAGLATLLYRALSYHEQRGGAGGEISSTPLRLRTSARAVFVTAFLLAAAHGFLDEWHQSFVPHRNPSLADVGIDAIGAGVALAIVATVNGSIHRAAGRECDDPNPEVHHPFQHRNP